MYVHQTEKSKGFTIVELLIVIVVVGILAVIITATYSETQARANDSKIKSAVNQIEQAIYIFATTTDRQLYSGAQSTGVITANGICPGASVASGFAAKNSYSCTLEDLLLYEKLIPPVLFSSLPPSEYRNISRDTIMFYQCGPIVDNKYALY